MSSGESRDRQNGEEHGQEQQVSDLLPGYVLGVLDDDERLAVEVELARSQAARREFDRYQSTIDNLNEGTPLAIPPDQLKARILSSAGAAGPPAAPVPIRRTLLQRALAAAAALLILVLGGAVAVLLGEVGERDDQLAYMESSLANRSQTDFTQPLVWSTIGTNSAGSPAKGYFCRTEDGSVGWIIVENMHIDEGHVLQLWLVDGDRMVNGGMFATDEAGRGFGVVRVDVPVHTFSQIWITIEPPGGSPQPTTDPDVKAPIV